MARLCKWSQTWDVVKALPDGAAVLAAGTVVVTGANTGIGCEAAGELAALGGRVVFACRDPAKGEAAVEKMQAAHPGKITAASSMRLNLSSLQGVADFVKEFRERSAAESWPPLKCLVLNAGVFAMGSTCGQQSDDGYDLTFAVNHLAHFLLVRLLLPELRAAAPSRVVVVASAAHKEATLPVDMTDKAAIKEKLALRKGGSGMAENFKTYGSSKLCNVLFARELHERELVAGVTACSLHPGSAIATDIARGSGLGSWLLKHVVSWCTKNVNQGASTTVFCSLAPHESLRGAYFDNCAAASEATSKQAQGEEGKRGCVALWELSDELCEPFL